MADKVDIKSDQAFRTISEAAAEIGVPAHVLRFWESRFPRLQPMKRAGGRRYYRQSDMALLRQIRSLLHDQGMTIRGAQLALDSGSAGSAPGAAEANPPALDRQRLQAIRDRLAAALAA